MLKYILSLIMAIALAGCCGENYTKEMLKPTNITSSELIKYYKQNKRFPNIAERNKILESAGCTMVNKNTCSYKGRKIRVESELYFDDGYNINLYYGKNYCSILLYGTTTRKIEINASCTRYSCISFKQ